MKFLRYCVERRHLITQHLFSYVIKAQVSARNLEFIKSEFIPLLGAKMMALIFINFFLHFRSKSLGKLRDT